MKKDSIIILVLVVLLSWPSFSSSVKASDSWKMSPEFYQEISRSDALIPIVIEFSKDCSYRYMQDKYFFQSAEFDLKSIEQDYANAILFEQNELIHSFQKDGISIQLEMNITHVMNAVTARVKGSDVDKLLKQDGIQFIYDNRMEFYPTRSIASYTTQVHELREKYGYTGKGITVGVLDSGIDRYHQDFSSTLEDAESKIDNDYVVQSRVIDGHDFADGDEDWHDDLPPGMHGYGHGTHVAGIIGGNSWINSDKMGMAPDITFYVYKVFTKEKSGARNVLAAIDRAFNDGCDIINMSLGHKGGSAVGSNYFTALAENIKEAIEDGSFFVVASAGNDGTRGRKLSYSTGSPASTFEFFSVAASNDRPFETFLASTKDEERNMDYSLSPHCEPFTNDILVHEMVPCGIGKSSEVPASVDGKIALIERGEMTFREKMENAMDKGAIAVILYNHSAGRITPSLITEDENLEDIETIPVCMVSKTDGLWLLNNYQQKPTIVLKEGRQMTIATFSSSGPTTDGYFKPEITAPGTAILSTFPKNTYQKAGGTSMSSPVVAGLSAVLKEIHPDWNLMQLKSAFMNTADLLINPVTDHYISLSMQGAGEARLENALNTPAFIEPQAIVVQENLIQPGDVSTDLPVPFTVLCNTDKEVEYAISAEIFSIIPEEIIPVQCSFDVETMTLQPNQKSSFEVTFELPAEETLRDHYDGVIWLTSKEGHKLHIPFIIYPHSIQMVEESVSNIVIEPKNWQFSETEMEPLSIGFYLHSGTEQSIDGDTNYNNFANIFVSLVDESGQEWALIDTPSSLLASDYYTFKWNGKTSNGKFSLFDGNYYLRITIDGFVYNNGNLDRDISYDSFKDDKEKVQFQVCDSPVAQPENLIISAKRVYRINDTVNMDFILEDSQQLNGVSFTYYYDAEYLDFDGAMVGESVTGFSEEQLVIDHDIDHGIIKCSFVQTNQKWTGKHLSILSFQFTVVKSGKPLVFSLKDGFVFKDSSESGRIRAFYPDVKGTKRSKYLLCDLNNDKEVDKYDLLIFKKHFGSMYGQEEYNADCDFNQDHLIDASDLQILAFEYTV